MTKADRQHLDRVASLGCMLCRRLGYYDTPAEIHHPRTGQGMSQRAPHSDAIPLCPLHHRGDVGVHGMGRKAFERRYGFTELDLLADTRRALEVTA